MLKIDSHHHLWKYNKEEYSWINDEMSILKQDFLPEDLFEEMKKSGYSACVAVQARESEEETKFLLNLANQNSFIRGVVGWLDLMAEDIQEKLQYYSKNKLLKGLRHVLQGEKQDDFMLNEKFIRGLSFLEEYNMTYDLLILPKHLKYASQLVKKLPNQKFVLDHIAKPNIKENSFNGWESEIKELAQNNNVFCKLSGMVTEANWKTWSKKEIHQYIDTVVDSFGVDRLMIGSDWPVCKLSAEYGPVMDIVESYFIKEEDKLKVLSTNSINFYGLYA